MGTAGSSLPGGDALHWCVGRLAHGEGWRTRTAEAEKSPQFAGIQARLGKEASTAPPVSVAHRGSATSPGKVWMGLGDGLPDVQPWGSWNQRLTLRGVGTGGEQHPPPNSEIPLHSVGGMDTENLLLGDLPVNVEAFKHLQSLQPGSLPSPQNPEHPQAPRGVLPSPSGASLGTAAPAPRL